MSTKWMVDVITLSNRARHHLCHNKREQDQVLNNEVNNLPSEVLFLAHANFGDLYCLFERIDRKINKILKCTY